jgi:hypothetical protein
MVDNFSLFTNVNTLETSKVNFEKRAQYADATWVFNKKSLVRKKDGKMCAREKRAQRVVLL